MYVVVYVFDNIYKCVELNGFLFEGKCFGVIFVNVRKSFLNYFKNVSFYGVIGKV